MVTEERTQRKDRLNGPVLRYPGGKWRKGTWIIRHMPHPSHWSYYVEGFGGGANVMLQMFHKFPVPVQRVYNETDGRVSNFFEVIQDKKARRKLRKKLHYTPWARSEWERGWIQHEDPIEDARRLCCHLWMSYSAFRNDIGSFRGGFAKSNGHAGIDQWYKIGNRIELAAEVFRGVIIQKEDAVRLFQKTDNPKTLHYLDPPYVPEARGGSQRSFGRQYKEDDGMALQERLIGELAKGPEGFVILSGYDNQFYNDNLPDWKKVSSSATTCNGGRRTEVLWLSPRVADSICMTTLFE